MFECQDLSKVYQTRNGPVHALENATFKAGEQEFLCLVGPSGCGKTTLLKLIAGLLEPTSGRIVFHAVPSGNRPRSALVFQDHGLFPWMTVLDNVAFGLEMRGMGKQKRRERARSFIQNVGLAQFADNYPHELSVGMQQRVGIARAFVANTPILLMDEPFGALDAQTKRVLREDLLNLWRGQHKLVIYVTHDIEEAVLLGDRVLVMTGRPGRIREEISIPLARPRNLSAKEQPEVMEIKWQIWKMLEEEVKKSLWIPR
ncbi:MAG: ABC transporter ATP-binding protein [Anaerolineales bacterium]|nr:ABC transporter ATP-binding protein [Anaerolineales bacterium]